METATIQERSIKKISGKLVKVMEDVSHIAKNGTNEFHKYQYATAADVLEKVNDSPVQEQNLFPGKGRAGKP